MTAEWGLRGGCCPPTGSGRGSLRPSGWPPPTQVRGGRGELLAPRVPGPPETPYRVGFGIWQHGSVLDHWSPHLR